MIYNQIIYYNKLFEECFQNRFKLFFKGDIQYITRFANKTGGRWAAYTV